jgi:hypothetical protein
VEPWAGTAKNPEDKPGAVSTKETRTAFRSLKPEETSGDPEMEENPFKLYTLVRKTMFTT